MFQDKEGRNECKTSYKRKEGNITGKSNFGPIVQPLLNITGKSNFGPIVQPSLFLTRFAHKNYKKLPRSFSE